MHLSVGMSFRQELSYTYSGPSLGSAALLELNAEEMAELAEEMVSLAEGGFIKKSANSRGNLFDTNIFASTAGSIAEKGNREPEYAVGEDLTVQSKVTSVRERIAQCFEALTRDAPAKTKDIFSLRFLREFDWVNDTRQKAVAFVVEEQRKFVSEPTNPLLLKDLKQQDVANDIGCHVTTVSRLIRDLSIIFPDTIARDISILLPGAGLFGLKARYLLGNLAKDGVFYNKNTRRWTISDEELAKEMKNRYDIDLARRTVTKYRQWLDEFVLKNRRDTAGEPIEVDEEIVGEDTIDA